MAIVYVIAMDWILHIIEMISKSIFEIGAGIISAIFIMIIFPSKLKLKIKFFRKKVRKWIRDKEIDTILNIKMNFDFKNKKLTPSMLKEEIKKQLIKDKIKVFENGDDLSFELMKGNTRMSIRLYFALEKITEEEDEEEEIVSQIEARLSADIRFRNFGDYLQNLDRGVDKIENILRGIISDIERQKSLILKVNNLNELSLIGILLKSDLNTLTIKNEEFNIEIFSNKIISYGEITQPLISVMKKIIVLCN